MRKRLIQASGVVLTILLIGCSTAPKSETDRQTLVMEADQTVARFKSTDPSLSESFFKNAVGYAVFPTVGKGAVGVGGAYGKGVLYEGGTMVGYCDLSQGSIGFQLGGQAYSELIFFENNAVLSSFKQGNMEFAAQASAVAASADASANADYDNGVAVFTLAGTGLMYEASIGGQKFSYKPKGQVE
jgi:lipid-binding SYLF domain-containing protein